MTSLWNRIRMAILVSLTIGSVFVGAEYQGHAQSDTPSWNKNKTQPTPKPKTTPTKTTHTKPKPPKPTDPLLAVQFTIYKVNPNNSQVEVSPLSVFSKGDRLRISLKSNLDVYLYVIHQKSPDSDGQLYFPDSRINSGQNFLGKNTSMLIPSACPPGTAPELCGFNVDGAVGQEVFIMIFTRNPSVDILEKAAAGINSEMKPEMLDAYANSLNQKLDTSGRADSVFGRLIRNVNPKANDKIVVRYVLNKRGI